MNHKTVLELDAAALLSGYRAGTVSPVEAVRTALAQIGKFNPVYNAFVLVAEEEDLLRQAEESERRWAAGKPRGALDGVPVTIKDDLRVAGWRMRDGSLTSSEEPLQEDAPPVARLREAGAIFIGKTTAPEFGHKGVTDSKLSGITRNPWNPDKTSGGSSGGAAVAAATGMGWLHIGSDGGGSVRIPASFCGVFGHKPSQGLIPRQPQTLFSTIDTAGALTRRAADAALMLDVISLPDPRDGSAAPWKPHDFSGNLSKLPGNLRIAYAPTINNMPVQPDVAALVSAAVEKLQDVGTVEEIVLDIPELVDVFNKHWMAAASWILRQIPEAKHESMDPNLRDWAKRGQALSLAEYLDAELARLRIIDFMANLFCKYDVLVLPTMALTAFDAGQDSPLDAKGALWSDWTPFTFPANLAKLPAASLPCGVTKEGLPAGVQIMAGFMKDSLVLQVSHALEERLRFLPWLTRRDDADETRLKISA